MKLTTPRAACSRPEPRFAGHGRRTANPGRPRISVAARIAGLVLVSTILTNPTANANTDLGATKPRASTPAPPSTTRGTGTSSPSTATVASLERKTGLSPSDGKAWNDLAAAYVRRAYETGDPSFYPAAAKALERSSRLLNNNPNVRMVRANLNLALHKFAVAQTEAAAVLRTRPNSFEARLALADATIEIGDYTSASMLVDGLVDQHPGVASLSRLSYLRQLNGDILGAETAMRAAVSAAPERSLDRAVALAYLGDVLLERGKGPAAKRAFTEALSIHEGSATAAMGIARLEAADHEWEGASSTLDRLLDRVPLPGALGLAAEISRARQDRPAETAANQLVDASIALFRSNGAVVDAELALLLADRGPSNAPKALVAARNAYGARKTIFTQDAMAWALVQSGRTPEAVPFITAATATNPAVASVRWHAAVIFDAVGNTSAAKREVAAAVQNQWFSLAQRPDVVALARKLGVAV